MAKVKPAELEKLAREMEFLLNVQENEVWYPKSSKKSKSFKPSKGNLVVSYLLEGQRFFVQYISNVDEVKYENSRWTVKIGNTGLIEFTPGSFIYATSKKVPADDLIIVCLEKVVETAPHIIEEIVLGEVDGQEYKVRGIEIPELGIIIVDDSSKSRVLQREKNAQDRYYIPEEGMIDISYHPLGSSKKHLIETIKGVSQLRHRKLDLTTLKGDDWFIEIEGKRSITFLSSTRFNKETNELELIRLRLMNVKKEEDKERRH